MTSVVPQSREPGTISYTRVLSTPLRPQLFFSLYPSAGRRRARRAGERHDVVAAGCAKFVGGAAQEHRGTSEIVSRSGFQIESIAADCEISCPADSNRIDSIVLNASRIELISGSRSPFELSLGD